MGLRLGGVGVRAPLNPRTLDAGTKVLENIMAYSKTHLHIKSYLRRAFRRSPVYYEFMNQYETRRVGRAVLRQCDHCHEWFARSKMDVDHIDPATDLDGFVDWNTFISRLIEDITPKNLQLLCKPCHRIKCGAETKKRAIRRKKV